MLQPVRDAWLMFVLIMHFTSRAELVIQFFVLCTREYISVSVWMRPDNFSEEFDRKTIKNLNHVDIFDQVSMDSNPADQTEPNKN